MAAVYDNWERLVTATLRREELRQIALRTPSDLSLVSTGSPSPSFNLSSNYGQVSSFLVRDSFTYLQILRATDWLNDTNLIKRGHSGDLYFGVLETGIEVVVKKVNMSSFHEESFFASELEICGKVCHPRLIPLLGYCLDNANEKFLVYKYMLNKDLSRFLKGQNDTDGRSLSLDWTTRLKIATGAVEGLCYLHHECFPPLVHGDIQASSILLDDKFEVLLGSLTGVCIDEKGSNKNRIPKFLHLPRGFGQSSSGASHEICAYDVYCFGKVLLELVTGKLGIPSVSDSACQDWLASILRHIVPADKKLIVNIVDSDLIMDEDLLKEAWAVAFVAKACLSHNPSKRPQMAEILLVLENLERLRENQPTGYPSSVASAPGIKQVPERPRRIDSGEASQEGDHLRANKAAESFFPGIIKKSFRDSNRSANDADQVKPIVTVNGKLLSDRLIKKAEKLAGPVRPGHYWYDFRVGFWGVMGGPCLGIIPPFIEEFNYPMPENCTGGSTGVFVNGRELHPEDLKVLGSRGFPTEGNGSFILEISGRILDADTGEALPSLGKLAPTIERRKRGFGMKGPKHFFD